MEFQVKLKKLKGKGSSGKKLVVWGPTAVSLTPVSLQIHHCRFQRGGALIRAVLFLVALDVLAVLTMGRTIFFHPEGLFLVGLLLAYPLAAATLNRNAEVDLDPEEVSAVVVDPARGKLAIRGRFEFGKLTYPDHWVGMKVRGEWPQDLDPMLRRFAGDDRVSESRL